MMSLLLWKKTVILVATGLLGLYGLFAATTSQSLHALPLLDRVSVLGKETPKVAVLEPTTYHSEVFGALLHILRRIGTDPHLYREAAPWTELAALLQEPEPVYIEEAAGPIERDEFDVVVVNTCDDKFWHNHPTVWAALGRTKAAVLCTVHELEWFRGREEARRHLEPIRDRLTVLTLGAHTEHAAREALRGWAKREMEWEAVPVHHYAPIFDLPASVKRNEPPSRRARNAGVLGRIAQGNRDYVHLLGDLDRSIHSDPEAWGYELANDLIIPQSDAFTLHLIGMKEGDVEIPSKLVEAGAVVVHENVDIMDYYRLVGEMDIIVPSFANDRYVTKRASASVATAVMAQTPILATQPILEAYAYLDSGCYVQHPIGMSAVEALQLLRQGQDPWEATFGVHEEDRRQKWWSTSTLGRIRKEDEALFRRLMFG